MLCMIMQFQYQNAIHEGIVALHIYKEKRHEGFVPIFNVPLINFYLFCQNIHIKLPVGNINQTTYNRIVLFSWLKKRILFLTTVILFCNVSNNGIIKNTLMFKCKVDLFIQTMRLGKYDHYHIIIKASVLFDSTLVIKQQHVTLFLIWKYRF